jgi:Domain of unknown function (DUF4349)
MSEPRTEEMMSELRAKAPPAPPELRERVRAIAAREPQPSRRARLRLRPALAAAAAVVVTVGVGAALVNGLTGDGSSVRTEASRQADSAEKSSAQQGARWRALERGTAAGDARRAGAATLPPGSRLQRYEAFMRIRITDRDGLSDATKQAIRDARQLGGYVVSARYATPQDGRGDASLTLRVPISRVQEAIVRFTGLGTLVSQRISLDDIQPQADRLGRRISSLRSRIAELERKGTLTPNERAELANARRALAGLLRARASVVREGTYARVALELTARGTAEKQAAPSRFDRFLDDAGSILAQELIVLLYALVIAGPFILLAAAAFFTERARRRRANDALLADH